MKKLIAAVVVAAVLVVPAGASAATAAQVPALQTLKSTLRKDVKAALKNVRKLDLARVQSKGFTLKRIRALAAGRTVAVAKLRSATLAGGASTRKRKGMTVAKGSRSFAGRGRSGVRLKPSKAGSSLLRRASRITLDVKAVFRSQTGGRVTVLYKVTLKRKGTGGPPNGTPTPGNPVPPVPSGPIPANAQLQYFQTFDTPAPWSGLSTAVRRTTRSMEPRRAMATPISRCVPASRWWQAFTAASSASAAMTRPGPPASIGIARASGRVSASPSTGAQPTS